MFQYSSSLPPGHYYGLESVVGNSTLEHLIGTESIRNQIALQGQGENDIHFTYFDTFDRLISPLCMDMDIYGIWIPDCGLGLKPPAWPYPRVSVSDSHLLQT